jgi:antitoxin YefM
MEAISYTAAREKLASLMDQVCDDHEPVIVTRNRDQAVVLLSLEDFKSMEETAYLLRSPKNARRLLQSVADLASGRGKQRQLAE